MKFVEKITQQQNKSGQFNRASLSPEPACHQIEPRGRGSGRRRPVGSQSCRGAASGGGEERNFRDGGSDNSSSGDACLGLEGDREPPHKRSIAARDESKPSIYPSPRKRSPYSVFLFSLSFLPFLAPGRGR
ncbi:unnamed protein product, partial [Phaeothamnion confervicola]